MNKATVAITLDQYILDKLDELINHHLYPNRSRAIQDAILEASTIRKKSSCSRMR